MIHSWGDNLSATANQVEQIPLVKRHVAWEYFSIGTNSPDEGRAWLPRYFDYQVFSFQLSIKKYLRKSNKISVKIYTVVIHQHNEPIEPNIVSIY